MKVLQTRDDACERDLVANSERGFPRVLRDFLREHDIKQWLVEAWRSPSTHLPAALAYVGSSISLVASSVMQLVTLAILARTLGVHDFGIFLTMTALATVAVTFCGLGASEPLVRRVARDRSVYPVALGHNLILTGLSGAVLVALTVILLPLWVKVSPDGAENLWAIALFAVANLIFLRFVLLAEQIFIAHFDFTRANAVNLALAATRLISAVLACYAFGITSLAGWIAWQAAGFILLSILCLVAIAPLGRPEWRIMREELREGLYFSAASSVRVMKQTGDIVVLGMVAAPSIIGSFGLARRIVETSYLTIDALYRLAYPRMAKAMEDGMSAGLGLSAKLLVLSVAIAAATALALFAAAPLGPILFGPEFEDVVAYLRDLVWLIIPAAFTATASGMLGASSNNGVRALLYACTLAGVAFIGVLTYAFSVQGTIFALYMVEIALAAGFWIAVLRLAQRENGARAAVPGKSVT